MTHEAIEINRGGHSRILENTLANFDRIARRLQPEIDPHILEEVRLLHSNRAHPATPRINSAHRRSVAASGVF